MFKFTLGLSLFLPLILLLLPSQKERVVAWVNMGIQLLLLALFFTMLTNSELCEFSFTLSESLGLHYHLLIDEFNKYLILLTALIFPLVTYASIDFIKTEKKLFHLMLALSYLLIVQTFLAQNLLFFYAFWECSIVPMFFIIGIWGGGNRLLATYKFVLFTALGSILMLAAILFLVVANYKISGVFTFELQPLLRLQETLPLSAQRWAFLAFAFAFMIKIPVPPFHTWLPYAHVEAPAPGSMLLAAILLKMGAYGFIKFVLFLFPAVVEEWRLPLMAIFVLGALYGSALAFVQNDIKKIVAYSSIGHMGILMLGLVTPSESAISGAMLSMLGHGLTSAALFYSIGLLYERLHTRDLFHFGELATTMPRFSLLFFLITLSAMAVPPTLGFASEFFIFLGAISYSLKMVITSNHYLFIAVSGAAMLTILLGTLYSLRLVKYLLWGKKSEASLLRAGVRDLNLGECSVFTVLLLFIFVLGIYPQFIIESFKLAIKGLSIS
ncbi:MAG: NADH-quinone oxidoreductase subunit M [Oligoflexia bacterium]|nr:NADH-quinone oxidoreductase subunit M [Oligoflexia bacterium]